MERADGFPRVLSPLCSWSTRMCCHILQCLCLKGDILQPLLQLGWCLVFERKTGQCSFVDVSVPVPVCVLGLTRGTGDEICRKVRM